MDYGIMDDTQVNDSDTFEGFLPMLESNNTNLLNANDQFQSQPHVSKAIPNHSDSNNKIIIIEPVADSDGPGARPLCKFFSNDIAISTALAKSPFGQVGISHFSKNSKRQLLVTVKGDAPNDLTQLLWVTKLGSWSVNCEVSSSFESDNVLWCHRAIWRGHIR